MKKFIDIKIIKTKLLIRPDSLFIIYWDVLSMLLISYQMLIIPLNIGFNFQDQSELLMFEFIINLFFFGDIVLTFYTGFYKNTKLIVDRKVIALDYLKGWFWLDLISSFPYSWLDGTIFTNSSYDSNFAGAELFKIFRFLKFFKILRLLKILKLKNIFSKFENFAKLSIGFISLISLIKLALIILFLVHWLGCVWHYIGITEVNSSYDTWLTRYGIYNENWITRYITSIYWACTTMTYIGYGDIYPITMEEKVVTMIAMIMSCAVFALIMNDMNTIIGQIESTSLNFK